MGKERRWSVELVLAVWGAKAESSRVEEGEGWRWADAFVDHMVCLVSVSSSFSSYMWIPIASVDQGMSLLGINTLLGNLSIHMDLRLSFLFQHPTDVFRGLGRVWAASPQGAPYIQPQCSQCLHEYAVELRGGIGNLSGLGHPLK